MDIQDWLKENGLGRYCAVFLRNDVDLATLPYLTEDDLKQLGLSLGHRRKLMTAVSAVRSVEPGGAESGPPPLEDVFGEDQAERRQLTVLFCDMAGSTPLSQVLDPEDLRDVLRRFHQSVASAVTGQEGHVAKLLGDGLLAYFGWPRAHEAQAERALRAALTAVEQVEQIEAAGAPLRARAGVATGPVVIGDMKGPVAREEGAVSGATPNLAARLLQVARPGEVVTHAVTRKLVGDSFEMEDLGEHGLKGFADPLPVWRVCGTARVASRFDALHGSGMTEFVGRGAETTLLKDLWLKACDGKGQVALVSGEAGIGKSRIMREAAAVLEPRPGRIVRLQCSPHEIHTAFHPLTAEIESTLGIHADLAVDERLDRLEQHLASISGRSGENTEALPLLADLLALQSDRLPTVELTPQRRKQRIVTMLAERMLRLSQAERALLLIEDVHWIDPSSAEVLDALVAGLGSCPALCVMSFRPEFPAPWRGRSHVAELRLERLGVEDRRAIAQRIAGGKTLPDPVLERIVEQTDGIPLFIEELTKAVLEAGFLEEGHDRYLLKGRVPSLGLPSTLQDSLMARLDRLAAVKRVIQAGACIGREFDSDLVVAAVPMGRGELEAALEKLVQSELIFPVTGAEGARYIFKHALVQDAAYSSLLRSARQRLHERLALALESAKDTEPLELARHFAGANLHERAAELYLDAGRHALATSALPEAIGALELGLKAIAELPALRSPRLELGLRVTLGAARMANFGWAHSSVAAALEPAFPLAKSLGDSQSLGSILWGLWVHYQTRTEFPKAHRWLSELETAVQTDADRDLSVIFDMSAGCQYFWEADYARAIGHTEHLKTIYVPSRHSRLAALTNHDPLVFAQHWAGSLADWIRGFPEQSLERMEEAVRLARAVGHPFNLVFALTAGATALIYLDETERLLEHCDEAEQVIEQEALGAFAEKVLVSQWRGAAHVQRGAFDKGYMLTKAGNDYWSQSDGRVCTAMFRSWIALALKGLGRIDEAMEMNRLNIAHCRTTGDRYMEPECIRLQGEFALQTDPADHEAAERLFREALAVARGKGARSWELRAAMSLARLLLERDRRDEAADLLESALNAFADGRATADLREAEELLAVAA